MNADYCNNFVVKKIPFDGNKSQLKQTKVTFSKKLTYPSFYVRKDSKTAIIAGRKDQNNGSYLERFEIDL
jgi:hypothetical protein